MKHATLLGLLTIAVAASGSLHAQIPGTSAPAPQQPPITFRAEVNYVEVDARVLDQAGTPEVAEA